MAHNILAKSVMDPKASTAFTWIPLLFGNNFQPKKGRENDLKMSKCLCPPNPQSIQFSQTLSDLSPIWFKEILNWNSLFALFALFLSLFAKPFWIIVRWIIDRFLVVFLNQKYIQSYQFKQCHTHTNYRDLRELILSLFCLVWFQHCNLNIYRYNKLRYDEL